MDGQQPDKSATSVGEEGKGPKGVKIVKERGFLHPQIAGQYPNFIGKHRLTAAISYLQNEIKILEEELDQLDTMDPSSSVCHELISRVELQPDPLLPSTRGPVDGGWDRWFRGAHDSRSHNRWI